MITTCPDCKRPMNTKDIRVHQGKPRCAAAKLTFELYAKGLRPYPIGHTMPVFIESFEALTRGAYEGHPREQQELTTDPIKQVWFPWWADIINELFVGEVDQKKGLGKAVRDAVLFKVQSEWSERQKLTICQAFVREGLRGARELFRPILMVQPQLVEEFEASVARLARG